MAFRGFSTSTAQLAPGWAKPLQLVCVQKANRFLCGLWYRLRRVGPCTVPAVGPVIIAANHTCTADPLLLSAGCASRTISFLIASEYANLPVWGFFVRLIGCIPVRRDGRELGATRQALRRLSEGHALGIFLEGRITPPSQPRLLKDGAALLALRSGAVVIPAHISGTVYCHGVLEGFLAHHRARVRFGSPVDLSDLAGHTGRRSVAAATQRIYEQILTLGEDQPGLSTAQSAEIAGHVPGKQLPWSP